MANTKVTGDLIASGTITAANLVSGTLDTLLNSYLTTNTYATQGYVTTAVNNLIDAAPASLDTLNELAAALNDDANFATTVTNALATKLNLSGGTLTGDLGIGISPSSKLHLYTSADSDTAIRIQNSPSVLYIGVDNTTGSRFIGSSGSAAYIGTTTSSPIQFATANTVRATIDSSGNVGIGTSSPTGTYGKLTVNGSISLLDDQNTKLEIGRYSNAAPNAYIKLGANANSLRVTNNIDSVDIFNITNSGDVSIGTTSPLLTNPGRGSLTINGSADAILTLGVGGAHKAWFYHTASANNAYLSTVDNLAFEAGSSVRMYLTSGGNVGINTTSPGYRLDVQGSMLATSSVRIATLTDASVTVGDYHHSSGSSSDTKLILAGKNLQSGSSYYGDYGQLLFRASSNYTGSARQWLVTNALDAYKFSIIMGDSGQALPTIGAAGGVSNGTPILTITDAANVGIGTTSPQAILHTSAPYPTYTDYGTVFYGGTTNNSSQNGIMLASAGNALSGVIGSNLFIDGTSWSQTNTGRSTGWLSMVNTTVAGQTSTLRYNGYVKGTNTTVERFIIDGNGQVGIGTNAPASIFHLKQDAPVLTSESTNTVSGFRINVLGGGTQLLRVQNAGTTKFQIDPNGGIYLGGSTAAANALDDYEEGSWTPTIIRHNGTVAASYTALSSYFTYVKIGRLVYIKGFVNSLTDGSSNGSSYWTIKGLPFTGTPYAGMLLGYKNLPADGIYIGDAGGQIIFTLGAAPYSGTWGSGREFMLAFVYETNS